MLKRQAIQEGLKGGGGGRGGIQMQSFVTTRKNVNVCFLHFKTFDRKVGHHSEGQPWLQCQVTNGQKTNPRLASLRSKLLRLVRRGKERPRSGIFGFGSARASLLAEVTHDDAKMRERRETSLLSLTFASS